MISTIKDVARLASVSTATVSKVLNKTGVISPSTAERVREAVGMLDYHPNAFGRGLVSRRTNTIGFLLDISPAHVFSNPFYSRVLEGIERKLVESDKNLLIGTHPSFTKSNVLPSFLRAKLVDGVILAGKFSLSFISSLERTQIPAVIVDFHHPDITLPMICTDNQQGIILLMEYLFGLGHRRFGFLRGNTNHPSVVERFDSFKQCIKNQGLVYNEDWIGQGSLEVEGGIQATQEILEKGSMPTAIICTNDTMSVGSVRALKENGYRIPNDISIVGFDDAFIAEHTDPPLTTIRVAKEEMGEQATEIILKVISGNHPPTNEKKMPVELVVRKSSGLIND